MSKLIIMKGLPGCGKTTRSEELMKKHGNAVRINKDLLRTMLHFDKFTGKNEGLTKFASRVLAGAFLEDGYVVIIDDTNLNPKVLDSWKNMAEYCNAKVHIEDMTDVDFETCIARDLGREKSVGPAVITNTAMRYGLVKKPEKSWVICDIDGTVADTTHRLHYVKGQKKDWKGFFSEMGNDAVREEVKQKVLGFMEKGHPVVFVSARPEDYRDVTEKWLYEKGLSGYFTLIMRRQNDMRPDTEVKQQILDIYFHERNDIHCVIDDRPSVIRMWKENGLKVIDVGQGEEF